MDKKITRKLRIASTTGALENGVMDNDFFADMLEEALELAYDAFGTPTEEHVEWVYQRLVFNWQTGAGDAGAVTLH